MPLVVISGCDGVGKSTIARFLSEQSGIYRQAHWSEFAKRLGLEHVAARLILDMKPITRAHFLLLLNWGLYEQTIKPLLDCGYVVICESYYFKFLAKERVLELSAVELIENLSHLPSPDLIVDVSLQPEVAFGRIGARINEYESFPGMAGLGDFIRFQVSVRNELDSIVRSVGAPVLAVDGPNASGVDYSHVHEWITDRLLTGCVDNS